MLNIKQLHAFIVLAECKSFALAAQKLHITQPALSNIIKNAEGVVGGSLFLRTTRQVRLTAEGEWFLPKAKRLLNEYESVNFNLREIFAKEQGVLSIACIPSFAQGGLGKIIADFRQRYPKIVVQVLDLINEKAVEAVLHERAEIGLTFEPSDSRDFEFVNLHEDHFIVAVPQGHRLTMLPSITLFDVAQYDFIASHHQANLRQHIDSAFSQEGLSPHICAEAHQIATMGNLVKAGLGVSILPELAKEQMQRLGLQCLPLAQGQIVRKMGMLKAKQNHLSVLGEAFWRHLVIS